jgi:hypothetical protein
MVSERCPSGRRSTLGKRVCGLPYRGFESRPLRFMLLYERQAVFGCDTTYFCIKLFPNAFYAFCLYAFEDSGEYITIHDIYFKNIVDKGNLMYKEIK